MLCNPLHNFWNKLHYSHIIQLNYIPYYLYQIINQVEYLQCLFLNYIKAPTLRIFPIKVWQFAQQLKMQIF